MNNNPRVDHAGYINSRQNDINDGWVVLYEAKEQGLCTEGGRYAVVCELHSTICNFTNKRNASKFLREPQFCEECMKKGVVKNAK